MIFSICNHHHIATELGSGCVPQSNTFHVQHTDSLVVTLLPCSQNQILPHLLLMLQNMCSAWFLFSPNSPFPGQEQPGLKIHVSEKKAPHRKSSKVCFPRGFLQAESLCSIANHTFKQNWRKAKTIFWHLLSPRAVVLSRPGENYTDSVLRPEVSPELRYPYVSLMKHH